MKCCTNIYTISSFRIANVSPQIRAKWGRRASGDATLIAQMISRASIGTIAAMDQLNPRVNVPGMQPWLGEKLTVRWDRLTGRLIPSLSTAYICFAVFCNRSQRALRLTV